LYPALYDLEDLQKIQLKTLKYVQIEIMLVRKLMKRHYEGENFPSHEEEEAQEEKDVSASDYEYSPTYVLIKKYEDVNII
jgi:hypothetical protein